MRGVAQANQEFAKWREAELSPDLFGLDNMMMASKGVGSPSAASLKRQREEYSSPNRTPKKSKDGTGPSPRSRGQEKAAAASREAAESMASPTGEDPWVGRKVMLKRGKYEGRAATVLGKTSKKYQVQVDDVPYQLEFYSTMFVMPEHYQAPKGRKKKKEEPPKENNDEVIGLGITVSLDDIPPDLMTLVSPVTRTRSHERMSQDLALGL